MMSEWKKTRPSGAFRKRVQKEREEIMKKAREVTAELRKKNEATGRRRRAQAMLLRPALIMNNPQMLINITTPSWPAAAVTPLASNNKNFDVDANVGGTINSTTATTSSSAGLGVYFMCIGSFSNAVCGSTDIYVCR